ncbi:MAG: hydrogenase expression/formation protein HypE [Promethearchaeota archaeon]
MTQFLKEIVFPCFKLNTINGGVGLPSADDGATIPLGNKEVVVSTDSHTVTPLFFAGGDIGRLAAAGTINDIAMMGAQPLAMTCALLIEEGFPIDDLRRILNSIATTAFEEQVAVIAGDTKVMPRNTLDKLVICTTGVGVVERGNVVVDSGVQPGDKIIITGPIGDHGIAILAERDGLTFGTDLKSDVAPLWSTVKAALDVGGVHAMKDPTRGGVAAALNELASKSGVSIWVDEEMLPIRREVQAASQMLGIDPLQVTCEGKAIIAVEKGEAEAVQAALQKTRYGINAKILGEAKEERQGLVLMRTKIGGTRLIQQPWAEAIPRVC